MNEQAVRGLCLRAKRLFDLNGWISDGYWMVRWEGKLPKSGRKPWNRKAQGALLDIVRDAPNGNEHKLRCVTTRGMYAHYRRPDGMRVVIQHQFKPLLDGLEIRWRGESLPRATGYHVPPIYGINDRGGVEVVIMPVCLPPRKP